MKTNSPPRTRPELKRSDLVRSSNRVENIRRSGIRAIFDRARSIPGLIHLELGEPDFRIPEHVIESAIQALRDDFTKYTPNAGIEELRQAISEKLKRENQIDADPNGEIMATAGAMEALSLFILCTVNDGDEVLIPDPGYVSYVAHVLLAGGVPKFIPLKEQNDFRVTAENLENLVTRNSLKDEIPEHHGLDGRSRLDLALFLVGHSHFRLFLRAISGYLGRTEMPEKPNRGR